MKPQNHGDQLLQPSLLDGTFGQDSQDPDAMLLEAAETGALPAEVLVEDGLNADIHLLAIYKTIGLIKQSQWLVDQRDRASLYPKASLHAKLAKTYASPDAFQAATNNVPVELETLERARRANAIRYLGAVGAIGSDTGSRELSAKIDTFYQDLVEVENEPSALRNERISALKRSIESRQEMRRLEEFKSGGFSQ